MSKLSTLNDIGSFLSKANTGIMSLFPQRAICILVVCCAISLASGQVSVKAKMDSVQIWIGQQTALTFEVTQPKDKKVIFPIFSDTIVNNLEIVEKNKPDTTLTNDGNIQINSKYTLTSFEDTLLYVPSFPFVIDGDTIWSDPLSLKVIQPFEIDTTSNSIADIKPIYKPPFNWYRFLLRGLFVLLVLALIGLIIFLIKKVSKSKTKVESDKPVVVISAHEEALRRLDKLKEEKLWQKGRNKEYHTELTDIIRIYIDRMFNIRSMEMTSDEILSKVQFLRADKLGAYEALRQILTLADLVKFAKWNPSPSDNELSLMNAYLFVNQTKVEEMKALDTAPKSDNIE